MSTSIHKELPLFPKKILGLAVFITVEIMMFAGLLTSFIILRVNQVQWPPVFQPKFPLLVTGLNSIILIAAGFMISFAVRPTVNYKSIFHKVFLSCCFLLIFLIVQAYEWYQLILEGLSMQGIYGPLFVLIIGMHALHVILGLFINMYVTKILHAKKIKQYELFSLDGHLSLARIYTWFVVGLWPCIYFIVYF